MTERDELWVPETWEKEDEGKMCKRLERGLGEVMDRSGGCTCKLFLLRPTSLWIFFTASHLEHFSSRILSIRNRSRESN
jgi:hypothetical protein